MNVCVCVCVYLRVCVFVCVCVVVVVVVQWVMSVPNCSSEYKHTTGPKNEQTKIKS